MKSSPYRLLPMVLLLLLTDCTSSPEIVNFDPSIWKSDPLGCNNIRMKAFKNFFEDKDQFIGLTEREIVSILGKPERQELYKRNQKFYFYYITQGGQCDGNDSSRGQQIYLRISATQRVTEINKKNSVRTPNTTL